MLRINDIIINITDTIKKYLHTYYSNIFSSKVKDPFNETTPWWNTNHVTKVQTIVQQHQSKITEPITVSELQLAIADTGFHKAV